MGEEGKFDEDKRDEDGVDGECEVEMEEGLAEGGWKEDEGEERGVPVGSLWMDGVDLADEMGDK